MQCSQMERHADNNKNIEKAQTDTNSLYATLNNTNDCYKRQREKQNQHV